MKVSITFRHMETTPAIREYIDSKVEHLEKFLIKPLELRVILSVEKFRHRAEILLHDHHFNANADETTDDMYKTIDKALTKIEKQAQKHKNKIQGHHKHHQGLNEVAAQAESDYEKQVAQDQE